MYKRFYLLLSFLAISPLLFAQESLEILDYKTDTTGFPRLQCLIEMKGDFEPLKDDFAIIDENGDSLDFTFQKGDYAVSGEEASPGRLVYFLVDASSYTGGTYIRSFHKALNDVLDLFVEENDRVNIGFFGRPNPNGGPLTSLESDFRVKTNIALLKSKITTKITAALNDSLAASNVFTATIDALDLLDNSTYEGKKMLILLSAAREYAPEEVGGYTSDDIIRSAENKNIQIHTINYRIGNQFRPDLYKRISVNTSGQSFTANNSNDIKDAIGKIFEKRSQVADNLSQVYLLGFVTNSLKDGKEHKYSVVYLEQSKNVFYDAPYGNEAPPGEFIKNYGFFILIGGGFLLGIAYWFYRDQQIRRQEDEEEEEAMLAQQRAEEEKRESENQQLVQDLKDKNVRLQEQLRVKEQEYAKKIDEVPTVVPPQKHDLKNTIISGGGGAPLLKISAGSFNENFRLNKPTITIGRGTNNDIIIPEQTVSSKHATITIENGSFFINDLDSTNGTFVNGSRVSAKILKSGDLIKLGGASCMFEI
ncbi:MAG: FHA domain-containing protein [Bacteroidota bacterium]